MLERKYIKGKVANEKVNYSKKEFPVTFFYSKSTTKGVGFIPHAHEEFEILYIEAPSAKIVCRGIEYAAEKGDIFVFNCNEVHSCLTALPGYTSKCIQFGSGFLASKFMDACESECVFPVFNNLITFRTLFRNDDYLINLFKDIENEFTEKSAGYEAAIKGSLYVFLSYLIKNGIESRINQHSAEYNDTNMQRVNFVIDYIVEHYSEEIDFNVLVKELYLDISYFSRIFKSLTGKSMVDYLNKYRINQALRLLNSTDGSVTDIAMSTGFSDLNYFSRTFKKHIGMSPRKMRSFKTDDVMSGYVDGKTKTDV